MQANQDEEELKDQESNNNISVASKQTHRVGWSGLLIQKETSLYADNQGMGSRQRNWITLDNGSTISLFSNPRLVEDIQE